MYKREEESSMLAGEENLYWNQSRPEEATNQNLQLWIPRFLLYALNANGKEGPSNIKQ